MIISPGYVVAITDEKTRKTLKENLIREASSTLTICEQMRFIYDSVEQLPESDIKQMIIEQLLDALAMAKAMDSRLSKYRNKYSDNSGHKGKNLIPLVATRRRMKIRKERVT